VRNNRGIRYSKCNDVVERTFGSIVVIFKQGRRQGEYYSFEGIGKVIWDRIVLGCSIDRIIEDIVQNYDVSLEQARKDVSVFVKELSEERLIVINGS
jgi:hypothetical protein